MIYIYFIIRNHAEFVIFYQFHLKLYGGLSYIIEYYLKIPF